MRSEMQTCQARHLMHVNMQQKPTDSAADAPKTANQHELHA
jgi:hypothetical protein